MSCLFGLFSCCLPTRTPPNSPIETQQLPSSSSPSASHPHNNSNDNNNNPDLTQAEDGYSQVTPLPRYTPRPISIQEKTLEAHMRDPPISSTDAAIDEKQRLAWEEGISSPDYYPSHYNREDVTSDVSSAISFPSSYGNTSTATRETPPPPYSPRILSPAPSRSMSISSIYPPTMYIAPPPPVFQRPEDHARGRFTPPRHSIDDQLTSHSRRFSWESR